MKDDMKVRAEVQILMYSHLIGIAREIQIAKLKEAENANEEAINDAIKVNPIIDWYKKGKLADLTEKDSRTKYFKSIGGSWVHGLTLMNEEHPFKLPHLNAAACLIKKSFFKIDDLIEAWREGQIGDHPLALIEAAQLRIKLLRIRDERHKEELAKIQETQAHRTLPDGDFKPIDKDDLRYLKGKHFTLGIEEESRYLESPGFYSSRLEIDNEGAHVFYRLKKPNGKYSEPESSEVHILSVKPYSYYFMWISDWKGGKPYHLFGFLYKPSEKSPGWVVFSSPSDMTRLSDNPPFGGLCALLSADGININDPIRDMSEKEALDKGFPAEYLTYLLNDNLPILMPRDHRDLIIKKAPAAKFFPVPERLEGSYAVFGLEEECVVRNWEKAQWKYFYDILELSENGSFYHYGFYDYQNRPPRVKEDEHDPRIHEYDTQTDRSPVITTETKSSSHILLSIGDRKLKEIPFSAHFFFRTQASEGIRFTPFISISEIRRDVNDTHGGHSTSTYSNIAGVVRIDDTSALSSIPGRGLSKQALMNKGITESQIDSVVGRGLPLIDF